MTARHEGAALLSAVWLADGMAAYADAAAVTALGLDLKVAALADGVEAAESSAPLR